MSESDFERGFQKGFEKGLEEGKKLNQPQIGWPSSPRLDDFVFGKKDKCPKCGITISGVMNYTCSSINCPTFYQATSGPGLAMTAGAVGASVKGDWPTSPMGIFHHPV